MRSPESMATRRARGVRPLLLLLLVACTVARGEGSASPPTPPVEREEARRGRPPSQWFAPLPHNGRVADLTQWWTQFDDALVSELIAAAEAAGPDLAAARARIAQSRATRVAAGAALAPAVDATSAAARGRDEVDATVATHAQTRTEASWEIDLFGAGRAARDAAQARMEGAYAGWHEARVSLAAEVAAVYVQLRACEGFQLEAERDALSYEQTLRLTEVSATHGLQSRANLALARAGAANSRSALTAQRAACDRTMKSLVALVAIDEPTLRARLAANAARIPQPAQIAVDAVPAQVVAQRPDLYRAEREVMAAAAEIDRSVALRYPRITLQGAFGNARIAAGAAEVSGATWSVGPIAISMPVFDGGRRRADTQAARARHAESVSRYEAALRNAVREVEDALLRLQAAGQRTQDVRGAAEDFQASLQFAQVRYERGLGSLFELEDARRDAVRARMALIELEQERVAAWIALYRALGGGWSPGVARVSITAARVEPTPLITHEH